MRIVVTGGAGFIGSHLVEHIVRHQLGSVIVIDNLYRGCAANLEEFSGKIIFRAGDICDRAMLAEVISGCDVLYHLAAQSRVMGAVEDPGYCFTANIEGTFNVLQAARKAGVKRVVFTSSREVYGEAQQLPVPEEALLRPKNAYGTSKVAGELYCRFLGEDNCETVVLRLANVYGTRDTDRVIPLFVQNALTGRPLTLYGGTQVVDFVPIGAVVDVLLQAGFGQRIRGPVNIGSGKGTTVRQLAERVAHLAGRQSPVYTVPSRTEEVTGFIADTTRARRLFGLEQPADPLSHLGDVIEWWRMRLSPGESVPLPLEEPAHSALMTG